MCFKVKIIIKKKKKDIQQYTTKHFFCESALTNLVPNIQGWFSISIQIPDQFVAVHRNTLFTMHGVLIPLALFGQKAEQIARGISFHALPPQPQMFTSKTSPLIQVEA